MVDRAKQNNNSNSRKNVDTLSAEEGVARIVLDKMIAIEQQKQDFSKRLSRLESESSRNGANKKKPLYTPVKITQTDLRNVRDRKNLIMVLDTNVVMVDGALHCFKEHDVYVLQDVRGELDSLKRTRNNNPIEHEKAFKARNALKELHSIAGNVSLGTLERGVRMYASGLSRSDSKSRLGRLFMELPLSEHQKVVKAEIWDYYGEFLDKDIADHRILVSVLMLMHTQAKKRSKRMTVVFVSSDVGCRLLASQLNIICEGFIHDDLDETNLYKHEIVLSESFWNKQPKITYDNSTDETKFDLKGSELLKVYPGMFLQIPRSDKTLYLRVIRKPSPQIATVKYVKQRKVFGTEPRSIEQRYAFDALFDNDLEVVNITGKAGTGKTYIALLVGIFLVLKGVFEKVLVTREPIPLGKELGFLPGSELKKLKAWHQAVFDNIKEMYRIYSEAGNGEWKIQDFFGAVEIIDSNTLRGRSIHRHYVIHDECQNNTPHQQKAIASRIGSGTKYVCCGNLAQIDLGMKVPKKETGIARMVLVYKEEEIASSIHLQINERSRTSEAAERL